MMDRGLESRDLDLIELDSTSDDPRHPIS